MALKPSFFFFLVRVFLAASVSVAFAAEPVPSPPRAGGLVSRAGGSVAWARLVTESSSWKVHQTNDPLLADFIRRHSTLNLEPKCYPADSGQLEDLCVYPFIFTNNLTDVRSPERLANVREYLLRGGFIYIDRCVNLDFSLEQELFYRRHLDWFKRVIPSCTIRELPRTHEIFRCYFPIKGDVRGGTGGRSHDGIYGVYDQGRMVALLSLANYQCGWPNSSDRGTHRMEMIANIYVYAMTSPVEPGSTQLPN